VIIPLSYIEFVTEGRTNITVTSPVIAIVIVYGSAISTIRPYDRLIKGATADVSRKRKAAWPFGVATLGIFVAVLTATASRSN
jgi:hypothetical protein